MTVELVVNANGVPAPPVLVVGKKLNVIVPVVAIAPPPLAPNGSAVVFAIAIPVSNGGNVSAYGINIVVLTGKMLTTVTGPTSASVKHGKPFASVGNPEASVAAVQNGAMLAVTVIEPGVATAAVLDSEMPITSTSSVSVPVSLSLVISTSAVFDEEVTVVWPPTATKLPLALLLPVTDKVSVTPVGILPHVNRIRVLFPLPFVAPNAVVLFERCVFVRQAPAKPLVMRSEAVPFGTVLLVRMAAVPKLLPPVTPPMAMLAIPAPVPLTAETLVVVSK